MPAQIGRRRLIDRSALISLVAFFVVGFVLLALVPVRRAGAAAGNPVPERV